MVIYFLVQFVGEANALGMSEAQVLIPLPYSLTREAATKFKGPHSASRVSTWPQALQFLLQPYATPSTLREAVRYFNSTR